MVLYLVNIRAVLKRAIPLSATCSHSRSTCSTPAETRGISPNLEFSPDCDEATRQMLEKDFQVYKDFISAEEENNLLEELEVKFKRSRYQYDHWDDVSLKFRVHVGCLTVE
jgi:hypothetical protein